MAARSCPATPTEHCSSPRETWQLSRLAIDVSLVIVCDVDGPFGLVEFPADDPDRARRFWSGLLDIELGERTRAEGRGWQTHSGAPVLGIHERGVGPGDTASLPYFNVPQMEAALEKVTALGGSVIHPGARWSICRDSEGSPFGLALASPP
jgi:predicted enzyme related to lactoylglutathione lyase